MKLNKIIFEILEFLINNAEELSTDKFSGIHYVEDWKCFRIHKSHFLPTFLNSPMRNDEVSEAINYCINNNQLFFSKTAFEKDVGWLTIFK